MSSRAWKGYLAFGTALAILYGLLSPAISKLVIWPLIGWSSALVIVIGAKRNRPEARAPWYLVAAGVATFSLGDDLYSIRNYIQHADALFPSYIDFFYLAVYPLLIVGLASMVRHRTSGRDRGSVIDASIITAGIGLVAWVFLIAPYVRAEGLDTLSRLVSISYPLGDIAVLAIAVRLAVGGGRRPAAFWLLTGSILPLIAADSLFGYMNLAGTWHEHHWVDLGWIMFYVGWGAAALHPSMTQLTIASAIPPRPSSRRLILVGSAAIVAPAVLFGEQAIGEVKDAAAISIIGAVTFVLVMVRIAHMARGVADERSEARFRLLIDNASDAIVIVTAAGIVRYDTPSTERMLGVALGGRRLAELLEPSDAEQLYVLLASPTASTTVEWRVRHSDGGWRDLEVIAADMRGVAGVDGLVLTMRDITERTRLDAELERQALHDPLTNLPNRALFLDRVGHALTRAERREDSVGVLLVDLDDFKVVNDSLGHASGDELLAAVAARLTTLVRPGDTLARLGGDEFGLLVDDEIAVGVDDFAARLQLAMREPVCFADGRRHAQRVSIGIAVGVPATHTPDDLLRGADVALYVAKRNGKDRCELFDPAMYDDARRRLELSSELQGAIERGELVAHYQPIVDIQTGHCRGVEALVRWQHPRHGLLQPSDFLPAAESNGLIIPLGQWMLREACSQTQRWKRAGVAGQSFHVAVNLSARHLQDPNVVEHVVEALRGSELAPHSLLLEVTETALIEDHNATTSTLGALKRLGVRIAVDDFGTGYSSLSYLSTFPLDVLKIDKSFTDQVAVSSEGLAMVRAVVDLASALGLDTVAEGVEHHAQTAALKGVGCTLAQGFLFARPAPADAAARGFARLEDVAVR